MTITIDIATYKPARDPFSGVYFRRTEADRRPSYPVRRPNDGPGEQREQFARELAQKHARKAITIQGPSSYNERVALRREEVKMDLLAYIAKNPAGVDARRCIAFIQTRGDHVNKILIELEEASYITRKTGAGSSALINTVTDAGLDALTGAGK